MSTRTFIAPGQRYGRLTVVERTDDYVSPAGYRKTAWTCRCDCGRETTTLGNRLAAGAVRSCGCLVIETLKSRRVDITGLRIGPLVAVHHLPSHISPAGFRSAMWRWRCDCGAMVDAQPSNVRRTLGGCRHQSNPGNVT